MKLIFLLSIFFCNFFPAKSIDPDYVRKNYQEAVSDKKICAEMIKKLSAEKESSVHLAYLGAFQTIWAKHTLNPIEKLSTFKKGKKNIEKAVAQSEDNVEVRFIRLSIQENCPRFLGYRDNIEEDRKYLSNNLYKISSPILKKMVEPLLK